MNGNEKVPAAIIRLVRATLGARWQQPVLSRFDIADWLEYYAGQVRTGVSGEDTP